jgi:hypothetical protein
MKQLASILLSILLLVGCAPQLPSNTLVVPTTVTPLQATAASPTQVPETPTAATSTPTPTATDTANPQPFILEFTPVPSETPLPTLELPTLVPNRVALQIWDGQPTYLAESNPSYEFRLRFDPLIWALTTDQFGFPALGHRTISGCIMSPTSGRGLALNGTVEHDLRKIGGINYDINSAFVNGVRRFVSYTGGDGNIYTAFQVSFQDQSDACLMDAETVLATLSSVSVSQATPLATPTP